jgi:hypothetical protein
MNRLRRDGRAAAPWSDFRIATEALMAQEFAELALVYVTQNRAPLESAGGAASSRGGPGWFDSSFDLHRGLEVKESGSGDAALRAWIDEFLGPQRTAGRIASPSASTAMA